jgi:hypothetical protein
LYRFGNVFGAYRIAGREIGDRTRDACDAIERSG